MAALTADFADKGGHFAPLKKYATYRDVDQADNSQHHGMSLTRLRRQSAPSLHIITASASQPFTISQSDVGEYEHFIHAHCNKLLPSCSCIVCKPNLNPNNDNNAVTVAAAPQTQTLTRPKSAAHAKYSTTAADVSAEQRNLRVSRTLSPAVASTFSFAHTHTHTHHHRRHVSGARLYQSRAHSHSISSPDLSDDPSADSSYSMAVDCEDTKNLSLIRVIGTGMKHNLPRLLHILCDINMRMLYQQYLSHASFFDACVATQNEEQKTTNSDNDDDDDADDSDDSDDEQFNSVHSMLGADDVVSPLATATAMGRRESLRLSAPSLTVLDSVPLISSPRIVRYRSKAWSELNKLPIHQALHTYQSRLLPPLNFAPRYLIKDSIHEYLQQVSLITAAVHKLVSDHGMPMQFDLMIVSSDATKTKETTTPPQKVEQCADLIPPCSSEDATACNQQHHMDDDIGADVRKRLLSLPDVLHDHFFKDAIGVRPGADNRDFIRARLQKAMDMVNFLSTSTQHGRYVCIIDRKGARTPVRSTSSALDSNDDEEKSDTPEDMFYFFQPPKPFGDLTHGIVMSEAMHLNTMDFLLPAVKGEHCPIGARHLVGGKMFCLSFHVLSKEHINCYLYVDQKCMKLELKAGRPMTDLMRILPHYLDDAQFEVLDVRARLQGQKYEARERQQFEQAVGMLFGEFDDERIESDVAQPLENMEESMIARTLKEKYKWKPQRLQCLYHDLRDLFGFTKQSKKGNAAKFGTIDVQYNEMVRKLGINKNVRKRTSGKAIVNT